MYEANPMSWLVEQAGGAATNGRERILDIQPKKLHERVSVVLGLEERGRAGDELPPRGEVRAAVAGFGRRSG